MGQASRDAGVVRSPTALGSRTNLAPHRAASRAATRARCCPQTRRGRRSCSRSRTPSRSSSTSSARTLPWASSQRCVAGRRHSCRVPRDCVFASRLCLASCCGALPPPRQRICRPRPTAGPSQKKLAAQLAGSDATVCLATASHAKFPDAVQQSIPRDQIPVVGAVQELKGLKTLKRLIPASEARRSGASSEAWRGAESGGGQWWAQRGRPNRPPECRAVAWSPASCAGRSESCAAGGASAQRSSAVLWVRVACGAARTGTRRRRCCLHDLPEAAAPHGVTGGGRSVSETRSLK